MDDSSDGINTLGVGGIGKNEGRSLSVSKIVLGLPANVIADDMQAVL